MKKSLSGKPITFADIKAKGEKVLSAFMESTFRINKILAGFLVCCLTIICFNIYLYATSPSENKNNKVFIHSTLPVPTASKLPYWRGFNLTEKMNANNQSAFKESDFRMISELGFNFVRIPLDYRCWIKNNEWYQINENILEEIDQAVEWGKKYNIHVCLNFHRAPGFTVAIPYEAKSLWYDSDAQDACAYYWALFAERYKGIPNENLSFNLINEPSGVENNTYANVVKKIVDKIREQDPDRLIIADGTNTAINPVPELSALNIAQSVHVYAPIQLTLYKAPWLANSDEFHLPEWPFNNPISRYIFGPYKKDFSEPLVINGRFEKQSKIKLHIQTVSNIARLVIRADGKEIFNKYFKCTDGEGDWKTVVYNEKFKIFQNTFDRDYEALIPGGTQKIEVSVTEGDWISYSAIEISAIDTVNTKKLRIIPNECSWIKNKTSIYINDNFSSYSLNNNISLTKDWLKINYVKPWKELEQKNIGIMVGEFGVFNQTPHDITLRWMKDCLENWKEAGMGWALWNFRGKFGILDSERSDVEYEDYEGHKLDRKMLELLQRY